MQWLQHTYHRWVILIDLHSEQFRDLEAKSSNENINLHIPYKQANRVYLNGDTHPDVRLNDEHPLEQALVFNIAYGIIVLTILSRAFILVA